MSRWPKDTPKDLARFYGNPDIGEPGRQLVPVKPPFKMYYDGKPVAAIQFHKKAAPALKAALQQIWADYGFDQAKIDAAGISKYAGSYNPRKIRGSDTRWSNHAYGAAIDINAEENGLYAKGNIPPAVVAAFKAQGAKWGGDYKGRKDPMHFEFVDNGETDVQPMAFVDSDQADEPTAVVPVDATPAEQNDKIQASAEADTETRKSWLSRKWTTITGWLSGGAGAGALGFLYDWRAVAGVAAFAAFCIILLLFVMGPGNVRAWIRKQVA